jgi:hypothetical protein
MLPSDPLQAEQCIRYDFRVCQALAMAVAAAQLAGSKIEDGSSHWLAEEINEPDEVLTKFRLRGAAGDLNSALSHIGDGRNGGGASDAARSFEKPQAGDEARGSPPAGQHVFEKWRLAK